MIKPSIEHRPAIQPLPGTRRRHARAARGACCVALAAMATACDESDRSAVPRRAHADSTDDVRSVTATAELGPIETIQLLRAYRARGRYSRIEEFLLPEQCAIIVAHIRAVDRLSAAVELLQDRVRKHLGPANARTYENYAQVANVAGVFSTEVTLLTEKIDGDRARITFQVGSHLPLDTVDMVRADDHWVLQADPVEGVPEQLLKLAFLLERMADRIAREDLTGEELSREIALRQSTIVRHIEELVAAAESSASGAGRGSK